MNGNLDKLCVQPHYNSLEGFKKTYFKRQVMENLEISSATFYAKLTSNKWNKIEKAYIQETLFPKVDAL